MHCIKYAKIQVFTDPYSAVFYAVMVGHFSQVATTSADIEKVKKKEIHMVYHTFWQKF